jgi:signal transduction histidine kinase
MREAIGRVWRFAESRWGDVAVAGIIAGWTLAFLFTEGPGGDQRWWVIAFLPPFCTAMAIRRRWPLMAAVLAAAGLIVLVPLGQSAFLNDWVTLPFIWTPFLIGYSLGADTGIVRGLIGAAVLTIGLQIQNQGFVPVFVMMTFGPWIVGRVAKSRRKLTEQLVARNRELLEQQEIFARESVRYERARIARELHDIVAHCLSVMVVQASAGQRVTVAGGMARALESVAEAAAQAQEEIGRLVELLSGDFPDGQEPTLAMVDELVSRAVLAGLDVSCRIAGSYGDLSPAVSQVAYRVVQEALTNALKHAPGAPVTVTITAAPAQVAIEIQNDAPAQRRSGLEAAGGGYGLAGMRERAAACGGSLAAGPAEAGGWRVSAVLPARILA